MIDNDYSNILKTLNEKKVDPRIRASVIIPTYQKRDSLKKVLMALAKQTYPPNLFEVIVSDDGSNDGVAELVQSSKADSPYRLRFITHDHDSYQLSMTRNKGIEIANCEIVVLLDADMVPVPEFLMNHMRWHHVSKNVAVLGHRKYVEPGHVTLEMLVSNPEKLWDVPKTPHRGFNYDIDWRENRYKKNNQLRSEPEPWWYFCGGNVSFRREHAHDIGLFDEKFKSWGCEDADFAHRLFEREVYLIPDLEALALHLEHERDVIGQKSSQSKNRADLLRRIQEREGDFRKGIRIGYAFMRTTPYKADSIGIVRWVEIAKSLGRLGYQVDLISDRIHETRPFAWNVWLRAWSEVNIMDYQVLKTAYHHSIREIEGIGEHGCVISRIAHVILPDNEIFQKDKSPDQLEIYLDAQQKISRIARVVGLTTQTYIQIWNEHYNHDIRCSAVLASTGVPVYVPEVLGYNPFEEGTRNALYCGNLSYPRFPEILNQLAPELEKRGINLYVLGYGHFIDDIDTRYIKIVPQVPVEKIWKVQSFADVGIAIATKPGQESESSKIPHYMRSGLPCVAEEDIGNAHILENGRWGLTVPYGDIPCFVDAIEETVERRWDRSAMARHAVEHLSWDSIARRYDAAIAKVLGV